MEEWYCGDLRVGTKVAKDGDEEVIGDFLALVLVLA